MIKVSVEVREGAARFSVAVRARSIRRAVGGARALRGRYHGLTENVANRRRVNTTATATGSKDNTSKFYAPSAVVGC